DIAVPFAMMPVEQRKKLKVGQRTGEPRMYSWESGKKDTLAGVLWRVSVARTLLSAPRACPERSRRECPYYSFGEKSVMVIKVESTFSTIFPFASDLSRTLTQSGSLRNASQLAVAASRLGWEMMYTSVLPLSGSSVGAQ